MKSLSVWIGLFLTLSLTGCFTIVPIAQAEAIRQSEQFDPVSYVDTVWADQIIPTVEEKAYELPMVLVEVEENLNNAGQLYSTVSVSGAYNFMVKGQGTVVSVDTSSAVGTAIIDLEGYDGATQIVIQIGPRVTGESVRDGVGFIDFGMFREQTEFGQVAKEINQRIANEVLGGLDRDNLIGKAVSFYGVFTIRTTNQTSIDLSSITITPTQFETSR